MRRFRRLQLTPQQRYEEEIRDASKQAFLKKQARAMAKKLPGTQVELIRRWGKTRAAARCTLPRGTRWCCLPVDVRVSVFVPTTSTTLH